MLPEEWIEVASHALWEDAPLGDTEQPAEPAGELSVWCFRNSQSTLQLAPYRLRMERVDGQVLELEASQRDLLFIAHQMLGAALEGWPVQLRREMMTTHLPTYYGTQEGDA